MRSVGRTGRGGVEIQRLELTSGEDPLAVEDHGIGQVALQETKLSQGGRQGELGHPADAPTGSIQADAVLARDLSIAHAVDQLGEELSGEIGDLGPIEVEEG